MADLICRVVDLLPATKKRMINLTVKLIAANKDGKGAKLECTEIEILVYLCRTCTFYI